MDLSNDGFFSIRIPEVYPSQFNLVCSTGIFGKNENSGNFPITEIK